MGFAVFVVCMSNSSAIIEIKEVSRFLRVVILFFFLAGGGSGFSPRHRQYYDLFEFDT